MKALAFHAPGRRAWEERPRPSPKESLGRGRRRAQNHDLRHRSPVATNAKIGVPMNTELVNIIGAVAGILPMGGRASLARVLTAHSIVSRVT